MLNLEPHTTYQLVINYNRINALKAHISNEQLSEVFQIYLSETKVLHQALILAISQQDWTNATNYLHQWKGAALNIGLDELGNWLHYQETNFNSPPTALFLIELSALVETSNNSIKAYLYPSIKPQ